MKCRSSTERQSGSLLVGQIGGLSCQLPVLGHTPILRVAAHAGVAAGKDRLPNLECTHVLTDCFNFLGKLGPQNWLPGSEDSKDQTRDESEAGRHIASSHPIVS